MRTQHVNEDGASSNIKKVGRPSRSPKWTFMPQMPWVLWMVDTYEGAADADAIVMLTEWNEFRALDLRRLASVMKHPRMADVRNNYNRAEVVAAGFTAYHGVWR